MKKLLKNVAVSSMLLVACFVCVVAVNAASATSTLTYNNSVTVTKSSVGTSFLTTINATGIYNVSPISVQTQVGGKMFNLAWYDSGKSTTKVATTGYNYPTRWSANGTYDTRAIWTNMTSGSTISAAFTLN